jgi:hypothetical protein
MSRTSSLIGSLALATLIAGCGPSGCGPNPPVTLKTATLPPVATSSPYEMWHQINGPCPGVLGTGDWYAAGPGQVVAGLSDLFDSSACDEREEQLYRGQVAFDFWQFDQIVGATLTFGVDSSWSPSVAIDSNGQPYQDNPPMSHATTLGMSTGLKQGDQGPYFWDFDNPTTMPACTNAACSLDVTWEAKAWIAKTHDNWGFIIAGPNLDFPNNLPQDDVGVISYYGEFQLNVLYNPALNPRAPQ